MRVGTKVALSTVIVLGAVIYMVVSTVQSGEALEFYKHVQEVTAEPQRWQGQRLQVHGNVVAGSVLKKPGSLDFRFAMHQEGKWLDVTYRGVLPDAFKDCSELVVKGRLIDPSTFEALSISAKCPSKYEGKLRQEGCGENLLSSVQEHRRNQGR